MSHVSKEVAEKLKKLGFREPVTANYRAKSDYDNGERLEHQQTAYDYNHSSWFSAPTPLQAADWLFKHHKIEMTFYSWCTNIDDGKNNHHFPDDEFPDHRNAALSFACDIALK